MSVRAVAVMKWTSRQLIESAYGPAPLFFRLQSLLSCLRESSGGSIARAARKPRIEPRQKSVLLL